jgi:hypothetical protein
MKHYWISYLIITVVIIVIGCGSTPKPNCITKHNLQMEIAWGTEYQKSETFMGYKLITDASVYKYWTDSADQKPQFKLIGNLMPEKYCEIVNQLQDIILRNQTLNVPADTVSYIEYKNPISNTFFRAVWNPKFHTKGNMEFYQLYDTLMVLAKSIEK